MALTREQMAERLDMAAKMLAMGHNNVQIHKFFVALAIKGGQHAPTYATTLRNLRAARRMMVRSLEQPREEIVARVYRSLWDLRSDPKVDGPTKLGALRQISKLLGLDAPTKSEATLNVKGSVPLMVVVEAAEQMQEITVVDGDALPVDLMPPQAAQQLIDAIASYVPEAVQLDPLADVGQDVDPEWTPPPGFDGYG